jgi:hypothetical protein
MRRLRRTRLIVAEPVAGKVQAEHKPASIPLVVSPSEPLVRRTLP